MKTLYISDLDGTLLNSNARLSDFTKETINRLTDKGLLFSYATARSYITAEKVTDGLKLNIPVILNNGAFIINNQSGEFITKNIFDNSVHSLCDQLLAADIYPMVFSYFGEDEKMTYHADKVTLGMSRFLESRKGDKRENPTRNSKDLHSGDIYCVVCMDEAEKLQPFYEKYKNDFHCTLEIDIYTKTPWLVINPKNTSKSNAIQQLKTSLGCEKVVVFGDGMNDIDMFVHRDESYAMENAFDRLKEKATAVIESNNNDGVAKWLKENFK